MKSAKPKLLILTSTLPRWEGDTEPRFVFDLAKALSDRFEPVIFAPMAAGCRRSGVLEGVRVERFRYAPHSWQRMAAHPFQKFRGRCPRVGRNFRVKACGKRALEWKGRMAKWLR